MVTLEMIKDMKIKELLFKIQYELKNLFGDKLKDTILYGSYARLENTEDSDIDVIALIDEDDELRKHENNITEIMVDLSLEYELVVSIHSQRYDIYEEHSNILPYFINIKNEGVSIHGEWFYAAIIKT